MQPATKNVDVIRNTYGHNRSGHCEGKIICNEGDESGVGLRMGMLWDFVQGGMVGGDEPYYLEFRVFWHAFEGYVVEYEEEVNTDEEEYGEDIEATSPFHEEEPEPESREKQPLENKTTIELTTYWPCCVDKRPSYILAPRRPKALTWMRLKTGIGAPGWILKKDGSFWCVEPKRDIKDLSSQGFEKVEVVWGEWTTRYGG